MFNILFKTCIERNELLINLCVIYMNIYFFFSQVILFNFRQNKTSIKTADNKSSFLNKKYIERLFPDFNNSYKSFNLNLWSFVLNLPLVMSHRMNLKEQTLVWQHLLSNFYLLYLVPTRNIFTFMPLKTMCYVNTKHSKDNHLKSTLALKWRNWWCSRSKVMKQCFLQCPDKTSSCHSI